MDISTQFPYSFQQLMHADIRPCKSVSHPENLQGITMKVQVSGAFSSIHGYTGDPSMVFPCTRGYHVDVSPRFLPAPSPGARSAQFLVHSAFKVLYLAYKYGQQAAVLDSSTGILYTVQSVSVVSCEVRTQRFLDLLVNL